VVMLLTGTVSAFDWSILDGALYRDVDYGDRIQWPAVVNPACPAWKAGQVVAVRESMTLPPDCVFPQVTMALRRSGRPIVFDCNGAVFNGLPGRQRNPLGQPYPAQAIPAGTAFMIRTGEGGRAPLQDITLRNCQIINYQMGINIGLTLSAQTREQLRAGKADRQALQARAPTRIRVLNTRIVNTHGSGIYVYPFAAGVQLQQVLIAGAGGPGLYLDADTREVMVENSEFAGNGFSRYDSRRRVRTARRSALSRREGIAIDASGPHVIRNSRFHANADGGIYLYKNCWEQAATDPASFPRTTGADRNLIQGNAFENETIAIWVGERADRDLSGFRCGDPLYLQQGRARYYRDYARGNRILGNTFQQVGDGIRVMGDNTRIANNRFTAVQGHDVVIGSAIRSRRREPVRGTVLQGNHYSRPDAVQALGVP
ncbi:MAG TPA: right-handed parallel beta-helix repeat-containing protein, partial [Thiolinea sp.]|nr:right-handed parallel beta-helix repeat-containing protein [Thiolinea sp.]